MESMGKRTQRLRKARELTQEQAAAALDVTAAAVSKWETDAACPDVAMLAPLARLLKVTVDELLEMECVGGMESSFRLLRASKLCTLGRLEEAQQELERYVDAALRTADMANGPARQGTGLYSRTELRPSAVSRAFFLNTIRRALEECEEFHPLRDTPAWDALLQRLEEKKQ